MNSRDTLHVISTHARSCCHKSVLFLSAEQSSAVKLSGFICQQQRRLKCGIESRQNTSTLVTRWKGSYIRAV